MNMLLNCTKCGKPLSKSNKYGMFCEDYCELEESKHAAAILDPLCLEVGKVFERRNRESERSVTIAEALDEVFPIVTERLGAFCSSNDEE